MQPQQLLGLVLVPVSLLGVVCNGLVVIATWKSRSLSHSFSLLTANQALFSGVHSSMFLLYIMPMYVLNVEFLRAESHHCGFVLIICSDVSMHTHFLIAINRFCAVFLPIAYRTLFNSKSTKIIMTLALMFTFSVFTIFFQILPCKSSYNPDSWAFTYNYIPPCETFAWYNATKLSFLAIFNVVVDIITMSKMRRTRTLMRRGQTTSAATKKKEMGFLMQSFSQSLYFLTVTTGFYLTPFFTTSKAAGFLVGNVGWCLLQALDGVFTLKFNSQIRKGLRKKQLDSVMAVTTNERRSDRSTLHASACSRASPAGVRSSYLIPHRVCKMLALKK